MDTSSTIESSLSFKQHLTVENELNEKMLLHFLKANIDILFITFIFYLFHLDNLMLKLKL